MKRGGNRVLKYFLFFDLSPKVAGWTHNERENWPHGVDVLKL